MGRKKQIIQKLQTRNERWLKYKKRLICVIKKLQEIAILTNCAVSLMLIPESVEREMYSDPEYIEFCEILDKYDDKRRLEGSDPSLESIQPGEDEWQSLFMPNMSSSSSNSGSNSSSSSSSERERAIEDVYSEKMMQLLDRMYSHSDQCDLKRDEIERKLLAENEDDKVEVCTKMEVGAVNSTGNNLVSEVTASNQSEQCNIDYCMPIHMGTTDFRKMLFMMNRARDKYKDSTCAWNSVHGSEKFCEAYKFVEKVVSPVTTTSPARRSCKRKRTEEGGEEDEGDENTSDSSVGHSVCRNNTNNTSTNNAVATTNATTTTTTAIAATTRLDSNGNGSSSSSSSSNSRKRRRTKKEVNSDEQPEKVSQEDERLIQMLMENPEQLDSYPHIYDMFQRWCYQRVAFAPPHQQELSPGSNLPIYCGENGMMFDVMGTGVPFALPFDYSM